MMNSRSSFRSDLFWLINLLFYGFILAAILTVQFPKVDQPAFVLRKLLFAGNEKIFPAPGAEFLAFRPYIPSKGSVSFIKDTPHLSSDMKTEWLYAAQGQLLPLILNKEPGEKIALVFCSNSEIAESRLRQTGYRWVKNLSGGKGIAEKIA